MFYVRKTTRSSHYAATPTPAPDLSQNHAQKNAIRRKTKKTEANHDNPIFVCIKTATERSIPRPR